MVWTTRTIGLTAAGVALLGGLAVVALRDTPVPVDLVTVTAAPMEVTIDADGRTRIRDIYEVAAPIAGTALRSPLSVGDPVVAGETVVARVEPLQPSLLDARSRAQAEASVAEARAALTAARTDRARAEEELRFARLQFDRTQTLVERGVASVTQLETVTQALAVAEAVLAAADAQIAMAEGVLDRSQAALVGPDTGVAAAGACCIDLTAPADGVVLDISMISAHPVTAGAPLVSIGDPGDLEIVADLLSSDAVRIAPGTSARVERWGGDPPLRAVLRRVEPVAETIVSALGIEEQRVDAIFDITTPPGDRAALGHGFSVFLRIVEWDSPAALQVPLGALVRRGEGWAVFVAENGIATERPVTLGRRGARTVEITSGLEEGAVIVTHPSDAITDGARVVDRRSL